MEKFVFEECKSCIRQWKEEHGGVLPIIYGDYISHCWNYGGEELHNAIDTIAQDEELMDALEFALLIENVGEEQAHRIRIGTQLNELREEHGLTYRELAERTGLSYSNINKIIKGKYSVGLDILQKMADVLGADVTITKR